MQRSVVATALITAVVFGVGGWFLATKDQKVKPPKPSARPDKCIGGDCNVKVQFACTPHTTPTNNTCTVYADPELIFIKPGDKIKFTVESPTGHTFKFDPTDGIKFASTKFTCSPNGSDQKFKCDNTISGTDPEAYYYSVHITGFDVADPWAVNY